MLRRHLMPAAALVRPFSSRSHPPGSALHRAVGRLFFVLRLPLYRSELSCSLTCGCLEQVLLLAGAAAAAEQGRDYEEEYERGFEEDAEDPDSPQARGRRKMENMMRLVRSLEALTAAEVYDWAYGWAAAHSTMLVVMAVVVRGPRRSRSALRRRVMQRRQLICRPCADLRAALRGGAHLRQRCAPALPLSRASCCSAGRCASALAGHPLSAPDRARGLLCTVDPTSHRKVRRQILSRSVARAVPELTSCVLYLSTGAAPEKSVREARVTFIG